MPYQPASLYFYQANNVYYSFLIIVWDKICNFASEFT